jgi:precorrin-8X/cobalt-precorrin-8 methylmutase
VQAAAPAFDDYLMVDWSAAGVPRTGPDSIWFCHLRREQNEIVEAACTNPSTRSQAFVACRCILLKAMKAGRSVLAGWDFPFGYPRGFAAKLGVSGAPWRAIWDDIAALLRDGEDNANNRFEVAAMLNRRISNGIFPFWGCPVGTGNSHLMPTHHRRHEAEGLAEFRLCDRYVRGPQPVWKLLGVGSVGSQTLTGLPILRRLRNDPDLAPHLRIWPFETGLQLPARDSAARIIFAEIYPSMFDLDIQPGEVKDQAQVRGAARHFARLDESGALSALFSGDPDLGMDDRRCIEAEEGWILGMTQPLPRNPAARDRACC